MLSSKGIGLYLDPKGFSFIHATFREMAVQIGKSAHREKPFPEIRLGVVSLLPLLFPTFSLLTLLFLSSSLRLSSSPYNKKSKTFKHQRSWTIEPSNQPQLEHGISAAC
jgi:hypothetical protein